jgi:hypothetical protein
MSAHEMITRVMKNKLLKWKAPIKGCFAIGFILILLLPLVTTQANAALFYTGGVSIDSLSATIDVTSKAEITIEYDLVNYGGDAEALNITYFPPDAIVRIDGNELSNPIDFQPGAKRKLSLNYSIDLSAAEYQSITFAPMVLFNDLASSQRLKSYDVTLMLPEGVERIIHSSMDYDDTDSEDGRFFVLWKKKDLYPIPLTVAWTTLDVNIAAVKEATPDLLTAPGEVEVEVTIQNNGDEEVRDIILIDSFFPGTFEAISPLSEFELVESETSDPHLYWKKEIDSLKSGETKTFTYFIRVSALSLETRLDSLSVLVGGIPVSVSNDIILYSELGEGYEPGVSQRFPTLYVIIGAIIIVSIVAFFAVRRRRKKA